jgi:hypothetical protein
MRSSKSSICSAGAVLLPRRLCSRLLSFSRRLCLPHLCSRRPQSNRHLCRLHQCSPLRFISRLVRARSFRLPPPPQLLFRGRNHHK